MKIEKNKIVFILIIACVILFIGSYTMHMMDGNEEATLDTNKIPVPELADEQKEYDSKLEALNDLKEVREINAPSIYDERLLDSTGTYDPDLLEKEKMRLVDSIYKQGKINYTEQTYRKSNRKKVVPKVKKDTISRVKKNESGIETKALALEHQLFFASHPINSNIKSTVTDEFIYVLVDGTQTVKNNFRLQMRLLKPAKINDVVIPKNTAIYGFVSFKSNRTIVKIEHINHKPVKLTAHDYQDGSEGIYIENSFRQEVTNQVISDVVDDINIAGVPQISGIKQIFKRNHRNIRVTIADNYKLILKLEQDKPKFQFLK